MSFKQYLEKTINESKEMSPQEIDNIASGLLDDEGAMGAFWNGDMLDPSSSYTNEQKVAIMQKIVEKINAAIDNIIGK